MLISGKIYMGIADRKLLEKNTFSVFGNVIPVAIELSMSFSISFSILGVVSYVTLHDPQGP